MQIYVEFRISSTQDIESNTTSLIEIVWRKTILDRWTDEASYLYDMSSIKQAVFRSIFLVLLKKSTECCPCSFVFSVSPALFKRRRLYSFRRTMYSLKAYMLPRKARRMFHERLYKEMLVLNDKPF